MTATERADAPYADARERLLDELYRADLLLRRHLESWWAERSAEGSEFRGLFVSDAEVDDLLARPEPDDPGTPSAPSSSGARTDRAMERAIDHVADRIEARSDRADGPTRLCRLAAEFDLDRSALDALVLALAPDLDRKYEKVYGYLQDDVTRTRPTVGLLVRVLAADRREELADRGRFRPGSTLIDEGLVAIADQGGTFLGTPVSVPSRVADYLVGGDELPARLAPIATVLDPAGDLSDLALPGDSHERIAALADRLTDGSGDPPLAALVGPDGATARAALEAVVPPETPILRVEARALAGEDAEAVVAALRREVRLGGAVVHVHGLAAETPHTDGDEEPETRRASGQTPDALADRLVALDDVPAPVFVTGDADVSPRLEPRLDGHRLSVIEIPLPDRDRRAAIWAEYDLPAGVEPVALADAFRLTRGEIADAVATARSIAGGEPDAEAIRAACRVQATHDLAAHAREIEPGYGWDDIVLPPDSKAQLREAAAQVRHRGTVFESWGFSDRYSRGNGINLLFTGPSGTGKTMAAEVVANDVGLPLFAIDLAAMLSKYIGETEKNLRRIFDEAERANAIVFFDEADALFGKRSEVSDAHDRYANVEIDYLLQRMESHDGCVILASNLAENIDDAFRRRINASIAFPRPDRAARAEIWRGAFPEATPRDELDVDFLADFELSGGAITNTATTAAFMAAEAAEPVGMAHVVRALRRELQKSGRLFERSDFEPYAEVLDD